MSRQVVILAGGLGTRLLPVTERIPKPLVDVAGKPFLHWQLQDLKNQNYRRVLLLVAYLGEKIQKHFGDGTDLGLELEYSFEPEPLGTGGALKLASKKLDDEFILLNGDSFLKIDLKKLESQFDSSMDALLTTYDNKLKTSVTPNLKLDGSSKIVSYSRAGGEDYKFIDAGVYVLRKNLFQDFADKKFQLETVLHQKMKLAKVFAFPSQERFYDIGTPARLKEFEEKVHDYF